MKKITFILLMLFPILLFAQDQYGGAVEAAEEGDSHLGISGLFSIIAVIFIIYVLTDEKRREAENKDREKLKKSREDNNKNLGYESESHWDD